jgi:hypothetical protein
MYLRYSPLGQSRVERGVSPFFFFGGAWGDTQTRLRLFPHGLLKPDDEGLAVPGALAGEETDGSRAHIEQRLD